MAGADSRDDAPRPLRRLLPLGELEPLACSRASVLLALDGAGVAGEESRFLQRGAEVAVEFGERAADAVPDGAGLTRQPAAADVHEDVDLAQLLDHLEGLLEHHLARLAAEVLVESARVDGELTRAGLHAHAGDRFLAATGCVDEQFLRGHSDPYASRASTAVGF